MKIFRKGQKNRRGALALALTGLTLALLLTTNTSHAFRPSTPIYTGFPTDNSSYLSELKAKLHPGAGEQYVNGRITLDPGIGALPNITTYFDARAVDTNGKKRPSFFQASKNAAHSVLASLYDFMVVDGPLFIGLPLGAFQSSVGSGTEFGLNPNSNDAYLWTHDFGSRNIGSFQATLQKVNVAGAVRSSALSHQYSDPQRVCVDAEGRFTLDCPSGATQTYSCTGTAPANASLCAGDDQGLSQDTQITLVSTCTNTQKCEYTCNTGYHEHNGVCEEDATYDWEAGDWGPCQGGSAARCEGSWTTQGNGSCVGTGKAIYEESDESASGQSYDEEVCADKSTQQACSDFNAYLTGSCDTPQGYESASCRGTCSWNSNIETHSCSASNPQSRSACESQNSACTWVEAQNAIRTRPVYCVESGTNNVVNDSYCDASDRPEDTDTTTCIYVVYDSDTTNDSCTDRGSKRTMYLYGGYDGEVLHYEQNITRPHGGSTSVEKVGISLQATTQTLDTDGFPVSEEGDAILLSNPLANPDGPLPGGFSGSSNYTRSITVKACGGAELHGASGDVSISLDLTYPWGQRVGRVSASGSGSMNNGNTNTGTGTTN